MHTSLLLIVAYLIWDNYFCVRAPTSIWASRGLESPCSPYNPRAYPSPWQLTGAQWMLHNQPFFLAVPWGMWDRSSPTKETPMSAALEAWSLNHWTAKKVHWLFIFNFFLKVLEPHTVPGCHVIGYSGIVQRQILRHSCTKPEINSRERNETESRAPEYQVHAFT